MVLTFLLLRFYMRRTAGFQPNYTGLVIIALSVSSCLAVLYVVRHFGTGVLHGLPRATLWLVLGTLWMVLVVRLAHKQQSSGSVLIALARPRYLSSGLPRLPYLAQITIPSDNFNVELLRAPHRWDMHLIKNFMVGMGPVSSLFDFLAALLPLIIRIEDSDGASLGGRITDVSQKPISAATVSRLTCSLARFKSCAATGLAFTR